MSNPIQIAVTGIGILCPIGNSPDEVFEAIRLGKGAVREIQAFDASQLKIKHAAEIADFDPKDHFATPEEQKMDRTAQLGIVAARRAVLDAGLTPEDIASTRLGLVVGVCAGGQGDPPRSMEDPFKLRLDDFPETSIHVQADAIASDLKLHGPHNTISTACASSGSALGVALEWLRTGRCDRVLVGGTDAFSVFTYAGFYALGAMAPEPTSPFSEGIGVTFGEGSGFVILESVDAAMARQAKIYGELMGAGMTGDAHHVTSPHPAGEGLNRAVRTAFENAGITASDVDYYNAHGTGTRDNDTSETQAIRELYASPSDVPPVSSTKSYFGHCLGAAGILEFIVSLLASQKDLIPPTINFVTARQGCDLDYVPNFARKGKNDIFVSTSAAFGGINAAVIGGKLRNSPSIRVVEKEEVWITGTGIVSPIGCGNTEFIESLKNGVSGIRKVDRFPTEGLRTQHAALVQEFNARKLIPTLDVRRVEMLNRYAMVSAGLALQHSGLNPRNADPTRIGMIMGLMYGSISVQESFRDNLNKEGLEKLSAKYFPSMVVSTIGGNVSQAFRLQGINNTVVDGYTAGLTTLTHGYELLRGNASQDALLIVAAEEVGRLMFHVLSDRKWTAETNDQQSSLGMYADGSGYILGEGGGALVIERATAAKARGAKPLARVTGYAATFDGAAHQSVDPSGRWLAEAIRLALKDANKSIEDIDWVLGHGRGVSTEDQREVFALKECFGDRCPPVSCIVGNVGVAGASMGLMSVIAAVHGMNQGTAFPCVSTSANASCGIPLVTDSCRQGEYKTVLVIGSTEHGGNTAIVLELMS